MLVVGPGDTLAGVAGTATAITVTATGVSVDATTGAETLQILYQGQLPNAAATLFTVTAGKSYVIKTLTLTNSSGSPVTGISLFVSGSAASNSILGGITLAGGATATFGENGWQVSDTNGQILVASITGGITQLTGDVTAGPGSGSQAATVVHAPASGITGTTLASNVVSSSLTSVGTLASGTVPTSLLTGTLAAAQEPAHTGDMTNTAGSLATSVVKVNGGSVPASAVVLGSNASSQPVAASTTGSGTTAVLATSPTFVTSATSPVIYGGSAAGSTLTLDGTSNGAPSNADVLINPSGQGNVGIGTTSPNTPLDVNGQIRSESTGGAFLANGHNGSAEYVGNWHPSGYWGIGPLDDTGSTIQIGNASSTSGTWGATQNVNLVVGGNVGIGTTNPQSKLAVVGLPVYANNAAAITGGLAAGDFYRSGGDPDLIAVVH